MREILLFIFMLLCCSLYTYHRNGVWEGKTVLWSDCVRKSFNKARPHNNLGMAYCEKGRLDEAIAEYKKGLAISPNHARIHSNLGVAYDEKGWLDKAITEYKKALTINPDLTKPG